MQLTTFTTSYYMQFDIHNWYSSIKFELKASLNHNTKLMRSMYEKESFITVHIYTWQTSVAQHHYEIDGPGKTNEHISVKCILLNKDYKNFNVLKCIRYFIKIIMFDYHMHNIHFNQWNSIIMNKSHYARLQSCLISYIFIDILLCSSKWFQPKYW
jgi:hypothetical protein